MPNDETRRRPPTGHQPRSKSMPSRSDLPRPGTPMAPVGRNSLRGVMQELGVAAAAAPPNIDVGGPAAIAGPGGLQVSAEAMPQLAVFQVLQRWSLDPVANSSFYPQQCAHASANMVFFLTDGGTWQKLDDTADRIHETIWHPCGYQLDSVDDDRRMPEALQDN